MKLYLAAGRYVGTQAEARKADKGFKPVDVPVDKEGLIAYLNGIADPYKALTDKLEEAQRNEAARIDIIGRQPNELLDGLKWKEVADSQGVIHTLKEGPVAQVERATRPMTADAVLSRSDNPGTPVDQIVETICKSKGYALKRYAGAVAVAFQALEN